MDDKTGYKSDRAEFCTYGAFTGRKLDFDRTLVPVHHVVQRLSTEKSSLFILKKTTRVPQNVGVRKATNKSL